jgi:lipopolysaccharide export system ATP-binding protein
MYRRARNGISYLPQEPSVFRKLTVEENILAILETLKLSRDERFERLEELIEEFHLGAVRRTRDLPFQAANGGAREIAGA